MNFQHSHLKYKLTNQYFKGFILSCNRYVFSFTLVWILVNGTVNAQQYAWNLVGDTINGEYGRELFGYSVSLNSNGSFLAVGAILNGSNQPLDGQVRVYNNINDSWFQIGQDLNGEMSGDNFGVSVSLNSTGNILAIGACSNDNNGNNSGCTKVYQLVSGNWVQVGQDINGKHSEDRSGCSVSRSSDGTIIAIGSPYNAEWGNNSGHVRVFKNISGTWTQVGEDIHGYYWDEGFGVSLSLNSDGSIIAIGAPVSTYGWNNCGGVMVFQNISDEWQLIGDEIHGENDGEQSGWSVSINDSGNIVAIGAPNYNYNLDQPGVVRIYENLNGTWTKIGQDINGDLPGDNTGYSVNLSSDGTVIAVGANGNNLNGLKSGQARVFKNVAGNWEQLGQKLYGNAINGQLGFSVCVNDSGSLLAVGVPYFDDFTEETGNALVFQLEECFLVNPPVPVTDTLLAFFSECSIESLPFPAATDDCGNLINGVPDLQFPIIAQGVTIITWAFSDANNNTSTQQQYIFIQDSIPPNIECLVDQVVYADTSHNYIIDGTEFDPVNLQDNCESLIITNNLNGQSTLSGISLPEGINTITWTVTDNSGNTDLCSFYVTVNVYTDIPKLPERKINIFPSLVSDFLYIESNQDEIKSIQVIDAKGRNIFIKNFPEGNCTKYSIRITDYDSGLYLINVTGKISQYTRKIIKIN